MKRLILFVFLGIISTNSFSQIKNNVIGVGYQYNKLDTTSTFSFFNNINFDDSRDSLIKYWGIPIKNEAGNLQWSNIQIPNVGNDLMITLYDGIATKEKHILRYVFFTSEEDKEKKLRELKSNQYRIIEIIVTDKNNLNIINNKIKTKIVKKLLEEIVD